MKKYQARFKTVTYNNKKNNKPSLDDEEGDAEDINTKNQIQQQFLQ